MQKKNRIIGAIAGGVLALSGGGAATAYGLSNEVNIDVYGEVSKVRTFDNNVESILDKQGVQIDRIDKVTPRIGEKIPDGGTITVEKLNLVKLTIDEQEPKQFTTEVETVGGIVEGAGYKLDKVRISPSAETVLQPGKELDITIETPKTVTFTGKNGEYVADDVFNNTVGEAAEKYLGDYNPETDKLEPAADTEITNGMTIDITRIRTNERTETEPVKFKQVEEEDDSMFIGEEKITTKGVNGEKTKTIKDTLTDGKVTDSEVIEEKVTKKPVNEVLTKGTKEKPAPVVEKKESSETKSKDSSNSSKSNNSNGSTKSSRSAERSSLSSTSNSSDTGSGLLSGIPQWKIDRFDQLAQCESGGNWSINTGNGFYGGIQFQTSSWLAAGGGKYAPRADLASREAQIKIGSSLQSMQGWGAWPACSKKYGYI